MDEAVGVRLYVHLHIERLDQIFGGFCFWPRDSPLSPQRQMCGSADKVGPPIPTGYRCRRTNLYLLS
jgi:hypothetical protein